MNHLEYSNNLRIVFHDEINDDRRICTASSSNFNYHSCLARSRIFLDRGIERILYHLSLDSRISRNRNLLFRLNVFFLSPRIKISNALQKRTKAEPEMSIHIDMDRLESRKKKCAERAKSRPTNERLRYNLPPGTAALVIY